MSRVKRGVIAHARHKKVKAKAKGYYGARKKWPVLSAVIQIEATKQLSGYNYYRKFI